MQQPAPHTLCAGIRPELHVTAETGTLEAPAGAILADGALHVFHQFRPTPHEGARWAHQFASDVPYDWDIQDDVLAPEGDELDVLAGSALPIMDKDGTEGVEFYFVSTTADGQRQSDQDGAAPRSVHPDQQDSTSKRGADTAMASPTATATPSLNDQVFETNRHAAQPGTADVEDPDDGTAHDERQTSDSTKNFDEKLPGNQDRSGQLTGYEAPKHANGCTCDECGKPGRSWEDRDDELAAQRNRDQPIGSAIFHSERGPRSFTIQRARILNLEVQDEISDDPKIVDKHVERLGPIDIIDPEGLVNSLVTPSVIKDDDDSWTMIALNLLGETDAEIVILRSEDRQTWTVQGVLSTEGDAGLPDARPFAPRLARMIDKGTDAPKDVIFITYPGTDEEPHEIAGYLVGEIKGTTLHVDRGFTVLDHGHDFTRPRVIQADTPVMFGLVGAHPDFGGQWANCLSSPRFLTLENGFLYQHIVGTPTAVQSFSGCAMLWAARLDAADGSIELNVTDRMGNSIVQINYEKDRVSLTRKDSETKSAELTNEDADTLTIFLDGPMCEVFADGGAATLTSSLPVQDQIHEVNVRTTGEARVVASMFTAGKEIQRAHAGLTTPEGQEEFMAEALKADHAMAAQRNDSDS